MKYICRKIIQTRLHRKFYNLSKKKLHYNSKNTEYIVTMYSFIMYSAIQVTIGIMYFILYN